jgi:thiopurine S-methyltransferase
MKLLALSLSLLFAMPQEDRLHMWKDKWSKDQIGWHEVGVHRALEKYGDRIFPAEDTKTSTCSNPIRVFVPLCGKSVDMAFISKKGSVATVVGVDGVQKALEEFANEQPDLEIKQEDSDSTFGRFVGKNIMLLHGDFFETDEKATDGRFEVIFDRASLVAIQPKLREDYVKVMSGLIKPGGLILLVVLVRSDENGPPFSVPEEEVRRLYEGQPWVEEVSLLEIVGSETNKSGVTMGSLYFLIKAKD